MPRGTRLTDEQVEHVCALIREGHPRNEVARLAGVARASVSKIADEHGLTAAFDRAATAAATQAKKADAAALRAQLELDYLADAQKLRQRLWQPYTYRELGQFTDEGPGGAKRSEWVEYTQDEPAPADQLKMMQASTIAANTSQRIADSRSDVGIEEVVSMLGTLGAQLGAAFRTMQAADQADESQPGE